MREDSPTPEAKLPPPIQLGQTRLSEYTKLSVLGKGTYGEVHKCVHTPTGLIVAMKTYIFEVSILVLLVERD
jgi:serine/threonine protein kinase